MTNCASLAVCVCAFVSVCPSARVNLQSIQLDEDGAAADARQADAAETIGGRQHLAADHVHLDKVGIETTQLAPTRATILARVAGVLDAPVHHLLQRPPRDTPILQLKRVERLLATHKLHQRLAQASRDVIDLDNVALLRLQLDDTHLVGGSE